ncbi:polysaccharide deacetylase family protein [Chryseomicrobium sp. FSL W7-1435]|uniref:polysaccharide deacetylase family protein n=1 Tax=Chryseomicrobium sp. FSL W7-1435 TaxID=2921704 RepID=UPI00315AD34B
MNKHLIALLSLSLVLSACADQEANQPEETNDQAQEQVEEPEQPEEVEEEVEEVEEVTSEPKYELNEANWTLVPIADAPEQAVLLTIDDAPDTYSLEMAETLLALEVPAIFFVNGHFIDTDEEKETLRKIYDMGFAIGNHTETHANLRDSSEEQQQQEIMTINTTIEEAIGEKPQFFRAPFGVNTDFSKELVASEGMLLMNWTYGYDWEAQYQDASALADIMVNTPYLTNGANLLMHDREWTAGALEEIVLGLKEKGYGFIDPKEIQIPQ